jgi:hypothetical protein
MEDNERIARGYYLSGRRSIYASSNVRKLNSYLIEKATAGLPPLEGARKSLRRSLLDGEARAEKQRWHSETN